MKINDARKITESTERLPYNLQFFAEKPTTDDPAGGGEEKKDDPEPKKDKPNEPDDNHAENSMESMIAQIAQLNATVAKLKADNDKLCTSEGNLRKQLRAKQTAEEQQAEAEAEQKAQHDEYVKELEKFKSVTEASERYKSFGMGSELARETATAEVEGDMAKVTSNLAAFMKDHDEKKDKELRAQYAAQMPTPQSGNDSQVDYTKQFNDAISANDPQAAALAILQQAEANKVAPV